MDGQSEVIKLSPLRQIGVVVKDLDKVIDFYENVLGIGPIEVREPEFPYYVHRGQKHEIKARIGFAMLGPISLEIIEKVEGGETTHIEFMRDHGEGLHHIQFRVENLDAAIETCKKEGIEVLDSHRRPDGGGLAYMESTGPGGVIIELTQA